MRVWRQQAMMRYMAEGDRPSLLMMPVDHDRAGSAGTGAVPSGHPPSTGAPRARFRMRECSGRFWFQAAAVKSQPEAARAGKQCGKT